MKRSDAFQPVRSRAPCPDETANAAAAPCRAGELSCLAEMHNHQAAHLGLGTHSIWLETPTTVRLSHLFAGRFADVKSLGPTRYQFLASVELPEDILDNDQGPLRRDVFLAGVAVHQILFGRVPEGKPPEWNAATDTQEAFRVLHDWLSPIALFEGAAVTSFDGRC